MTRRAAVVVAVVVAAVGALVGGVFAVVIGAQRVDAAVAGMARAAVGCTTTLAFEDSGRFWVYVETRGRLEATDGDCDVPAEWDLVEAPNVDVELVVGDDTRLDLTPDDSRSYDVDEFAGGSVVSFDIVVPGRRTITAISDSDGFAVAVGRDPSAAAQPWRIAGLAVGGVSLVAAAAIAAFGGRRRGGQPADPAIATLPLREPSTVGTPGVQPWGPPVWSPPTTAPGAASPPSDAWPSPGSD